MGAFSLHVFVSGLYQYALRECMRENCALSSCIGGGSSAAEWRGISKLWRNNRIMKTIIMVVLFIAEGIAMANERITEGIVRDHFKADPHYRSIKWDEQKTTNKRIADLLKGQSKGGGKGDGRPEFIISFPMNSNYLIVVECKADISKHCSSQGNNARDYAVDGVLHYAKALSAEFSVIAIAVSGESEECLRVSHFYWKKGEKKHKELPDEKLLALGSYLQVFDDQFFLSDFYFRDIAAKARELNEMLYQYSIKELSRCTLVSAVLLALKDRHFVDTYASKATIQELGDAIITAIVATFKAEEDADEND